MKSLLQAPQQFFGISRRYKMSDILNILIFPSSLEEDSSKCFQVPVTSSTTFVSTCNRLNMTILQKERLLLTPVPF